MKQALLLLARLFLGGSFLVFGLAKVSGEPLFDGKPYSESFAGYVQETLSEEGHPVGLWRPVLQWVVRPFPGPFAALVAWGELLLGLSLLLGALVTFGALGGILLMAGLQLSENPLGGGGPLWTKVAGFLEPGCVALVLAFLAVHGAGRFVGLDAILFRKGGRPPPRPIP
ncbi:MAG: DoxX family membrane protein [Planctomycetota bacterium]